MRHADPARRAAAALAAGFGLVLACLAEVPGRAATTTELVVADRIAGVALYGFDPVAYFLDQKARLGMKAHELTFGGFTWRFYNEGNRAAFTAQPDAYVPRFGGYDPVAIMRGVPVPGHPALFVVHGGRLYLFHRPENQDAFLAAPEPVAKAAGAAWPGVARTLAP